ncbi:hypothetical protein [Alteromonas sp. KUL49]|uniref:hypothetical protein n=1 Tax=Alteromonas sp. KUL49 TaxID=2480798 RepID=UPI0010FFAEAE|nr:hypothetical protein [Alteromonas sp. KUL49]GEA11063.1 hypothetical protein KUL49_14380 [Alteromonas sp. KUL49]
MMKEKLPDSEKVSTSKNAEKQRRYRERQKEAGNTLVRGYVKPEALQCIEEIREKTGWSDNEIISNSLRLTYAAYKCGQIKLLNEWLIKNDR